MTSSQDALAGVFRAGAEELLSHSKRPRLGATKPGGATRQQLVVSTLVLVAVTVGWSNRGMGKQGPAPRGALRMVDQHPLHWVSMVYNVFEHLMELDQAGTLVPRLATGWRWLDARTLEVPLRQGVTFHNGEGCDAEVVPRNWEEHTRLRQPCSPGTFLHFTPGSTLEMRDPYTVRFVCPAPDGGTLATLAFLHMGNRQFYRDVGWGERSW